MREHTSPSSSERGGRQTQGRETGSDPHSYLILWVLRPRLFPRFTTISWVLSSASSWILWLCFLFACFNLFLFNWRIIALQCYIGFCHTSAWTSHMYTDFPSLLDTPLTSHPIPISRLLQSTQLSSLCYTANSHWLSVLQMVIYMFHCCSLNSTPTVSTSSFSVCVSIPALQNRFFGIIFLDFIYMH